jgi:transposase-like protein
MTFRIVLTDSAPHTQSVTAGHSDSPLAAQYLELFRPFNGAGRHFTVALVSDHFRTPRSTELTDAQLRQMQGALLKPIYPVVKIAGAATQATEVSSSHPSDSSLAPHFNLTPEQLQHLQQLRDAHQPKPTDLPGKGTPSAAETTLGRADEADQPRRNESTQVDDNAKLLSAKANFISQNRSLSNPLAPINDADCAATSLAMALKMLNVVPSQGDATSNEKLISDIRLHATGRNNHQEDISTWNIAQVATNNFNLNAFPAHDQRAVDIALSSGHCVMATGARHIGAGGQTEAHAVLITAKDSHGNYIVNDPAGAGPKIMTPGDLQAFTSASAGISNQQTKPDSTFIEIYRRDQ